MELKVCFNERMIRSSSDLKVKRLHIDHMNEQQLLDQINIPADLRKLEKEQLPQVCEELRQFIINECSSNPGHLGASLGGKKD